MEGFRLLFVLAGSLAGFEVGRQLNGNPHAGVVGLLFEHGVQLPCRYFVGWSVLLDALAILIEGGGADAPELAAGEGGFNMLAASMAPSAAPAPTDGVELVDEEDDAGLRPPRSP